MDEPVSIEAKTVTKPFQQVIAYGNHAKIKHKRIMEKSTPVKVESKTTYLGNY